MADYQEAESAHAGFAHVASFATSVVGRLEGTSAPVFAYGVEPTAYVQLTPLVPFAQVLAQPRFLAILAGALGALVVVLTIAGVFGVVHHAAGRRLREMGIRIVLGATPRRVRAHVLAGALLPAAVGVATGLAASWPYTATLQPLLFGLQPHRSVALLAAGLFVLALVACASAPLARRASRVDAAHALRAE